MKRLLLAMMISTNLFAGPVPTLKKDEVRCFGREYSEAHLAKNPKQTVKKLRLKFSNEKHNGSGTILSVEATLKGEENKYKNYQASLYCLAEEKGLCIIECDGGSVKVKLEGDKLVLKNNGFVLQGGCGEEEESFAWLDSAKSGDDVFWAYELRSEYCQE